MPSSRVQSLGAVAQSVVDGHEPVDSREAPADHGVPMSVRLDFAVLLTEEERRALRTPDSPFGELPALPATLYAVWRTRIDLHNTFDLGTAAGYAGLWVWAIRDGRREIEALRAPLAEAGDQLAGPITSPATSGLPVSFPWIAAVLWCARPDLQQAYPPAPETMADFLAWFLEHGMIALRCGDLLPVDHAILLSGPA